MKARILVAMIVVGMMTSCSTTRMLPEDKCRLARNKVEISDKSSGLKNADITSYIRQSPNSSFIWGWNPFLNIYNWQNGSGKGLDKVWKKIGQAPVEFSEEAMENSCTNIADHLTYLGYYGSRVHTRIDTVRRCVTVHYIVEPGVRYPIDSIQFILPEGNETFADEFRADMPKILVHEGDFLSEKMLESETSRGAAYFNGLGYYDFNKNHYFFEADTLGGKVKLKYEIRNYTRNQSAQSARNLDKYRFGDVNITRSSDIKIRQGVLEDLNLIHPGDLYDPLTVNKTYNRISSLRIFNGVGVELSPVDSARLNCNIRLTESNVSGLKADFEFSTSSSGMFGISPQLSWFHKNIFHGGEWLSVGTKCNFQFIPSSKTRSIETSVNASLSFPKFLGLSNTLFKGADVPRTEIATNFSYQDRPEYKRSMTSLTFGYIGSRSNKLFYQIYPFRGNYTRVFNLDEDFLYEILVNPFLLDMFDEHIDLGVSGMIYYTSDSDIVPKGSYRFARLNVDLSGNLLKLFGARQILGVPYSQYLRGEISLGQVFKFGRNDGQALALRFNGGAGHAIGEYATLPYDRQFYVGGANSMRGWQARTVGPGSMPPIDFFIIPSQTGDMKLEVDLEYRFRMFWKLEGALFAEAGNIWDISNNYLDESTVFHINNFYKDIAVDWGFGVRVNLDFILLRLDCGIKLHDPSISDGSRWRAPHTWFHRDGFSVHFGVGYPF